MTINANFIDALLSDYDLLTHLECDGFTRIASYILRTNGISHTCYAGECRVGQEIVEPHFWIQAGNFHVDFRLRRWAGDHAPHGVFRVSQHPDVAYRGDSIDLPMSQTLFDILVEPPPTKKKKV